MTYKKADSDLKYRLINLGKWNDDVLEWEDFESEEFEYHAHQVLEVLKADKTVQLYPGNEKKDRAQWYIKGGNLVINFSGEATESIGPCVGHVYLSHKGREGIHYSLPRFFQSGDRNNIYVAKLGRQLQELDLEIKGDKYFDAAFRLERA